jgi:hypothetical protein
MGWFGDDSDQAQAYNQYNDTPPEQHKAALSHELIGGAAAFEAAKAYEEHRAANGHPDSHAKAKEIFAGLAGAFIDREVETKGLDFIDRERAKKQAVQHFDEVVQVDNYQY